MTKLLAIFILFLVSNPLTYVKEINDTQQQALAAFNDQQYQVAIYRYEHLIEKLEVTDLNIFLNLAHAYYKAKKWDKAFQFYQKVIDGPENKLASLAYHQLGMIAEISYRKNMSIDNLRIILKPFKQSIIKNPNNYLARYNYELLRKRLEKMEKAQKKYQPHSNPQHRSRNDEGGKDKLGGGQKQKNVPGEGEGEQEARKALKEAAKDGKEKEQSADGKEKGKEGDKDAKNTLRPDQLKAININQEKIKTIFEALRNKEIHYLQQKRLRSKSGKKKYKKNKPDW